MVYCVFGAGKLDFDKYGRNVELCQVSLLVLQFSAEKTGPKLPSAKRLLLLLVSTEKTGQSLQAQRVQIVEVEIIVSMTSIVALCANKSIVVATADEG